MAALADIARALVLRSTCYRVRVGIGPGGYPSLDTADSGARSPSAVGSDHEP